MPLDWTDRTGAKVIFLAAFAIAHAAYILTAATEESVPEAANQHSRQLLLCGESFADK